MAKTTQKQQIAEQDQEENMEDQEMTADQENDAELLEPRKLTRTDRVHHVQTVNPKGQIRLATEDDTDNLYTMDRSVKHDGENYIPGDVVYATGALAQAFLQELYMH